MEAPYQKSKQRSSYLEIAVWCEGERSGVSLNLMLLQQLMRDELEALSSSQSHFDSEYTFLELNTSMAVRQMFAKAMYVQSKG